MKTYKYNNHETGEVVEIEAEDILAADKIYMEATGINPAKCVFVGCETRQFKGVSLGPQEEGKEV